VVLTQGEHDPNNTLQISPGRNGAQGYLQSDIADRLDVEMDQKRTFRIVRAMSAITLKADISKAPCDVRFVPKAHVERPSDRAFEAPIHGAPQ
jgi:hypothetical protein